MIFPTDHYMEVRLIPNKTPEIDPPTNGILFLIMASIIVIPIALGVVESDSNIDIEPNSESTRILQYSNPQINELNVNSTSDNRVTELSEGLSNLALVMPPITPPSYPVQITQCNGKQFDGANFRAYPSLTSLSILGVVPTGEWVMITGRRSVADRIVWYEAINEFPLFYSSEPGAINQLNAQQLGWIADCFVES